MTLDEIENTAQLFRAAGRSTIPVEIDEWRALQMARLPKGSVKIETKDGKAVVRPVDRTPASLRRGKFLAGDRAEAAFRANAAKARRERA